MACPLSTGNGRWRVTANTHDSSELPTCVRLACRAYRRQMLDVRTTEAAECCAAAVVEANPNVPARWSRGTRRFWK